MGTVNIGNYSLNMISHRAVGEQEVFAEGITAKTNIQHVRHHTVRSLSGMSVFDNYECDGQLTITDYLASKIERREVKELTEWINAQGKCQYDQIKDVIRNTKLMDDEDDIDQMTNKVSIYVLNMSLGYMEYLRTESK